MSVIPRSWDLEIINSFQDGKCLESRSGKVFERAISFIVFRVSDVNRDPSKGF